ncbi:MAG: hypothetical protein KF729_33830 [Sandaracinaceae bacterium]|nr:hypothetical protein [Sandaracinaceae bacterium]
MNDLIAISSPLARPLHFSLLELAVLAASALVLAHALGRYRAGDRRGLFLWLLVTSYGVQMELVAFNFLHNYEHATFTVQLYGGQLPLYVTGLYGSFLYTGLALAERLRVHPVAEAFGAGLAMCALDVPFDVAGVAVGWWQWLDGDPNLAFRWLGVPVTSYAWYVIFGAGIALLGRVLWPRLERRPFALAALVALPAGSLVIVVGVLGFLPFHALAALGLDHGMIVALLLAGSALAVALGRGRPAPLDRRVAGVVLALPGTCTLVLAWAALAGALEHPALQLGAAVAALVWLALLMTRLPLRRAAAEPTAGAAPAPASASASAAASAAASESASVSESASESVAVAEVSP